jgi:hypothetical protein
LNFKKFVLGGVAATAAFTAGATEGGGSIYPVGSENFVCCALPPPGLYGIVYAESYSTDKVRGDDGQVVTPPSFRVQATAIAPRLIWVTKGIAGADAFGLHMILPIVDLDVHVVPGVAQQKTGVGDIVFGPFLGWHHSANLHTVAAVDFFAPTGGYSKADVANIGTNHWAVQPIFGISYIDPTGPNADAKVMYTFNLRNDATHYRSGQELIVDYDAGWGFGHGITAGIGGYLYRQTTDDTNDAGHVANNRGKAIAVGPSFRYDSGKGWFVTAKYEVESQVRNRADGTAFWLKAVFPF